MNRKLFSIVIRVAAVALILSPGAVWSQPKATKPRFERDILPILGEPLEGMATGDPGPLLGRIEARDVSFDYGGGIDGRR